MMTCCEFCGAGDDLDNMYHATIETAGKSTEVIICEGCSHTYEHIVKDIVSVKKVKEALDLID